MKKLITILPKGISILTALFFAVVLNTNATVWRVNNRPNVDADFTTLSAAITGASANDTIYVEGSPAGYGGGTFSKPLTVIGTGYWLNENDSTQAYKETSKVGTLAFDNGSEGSLIEGLQIQHTYMYGATGVYINTNDITIRRNYIYVNNTYGSYKGIGIQIANTVVVNSIIIEQNWIKAIAATTGKAYGISITYNYIINSHIRNNIIYCNTNNYAIYMGEANEASSSIISNNVTMGDIRSYYSSHYNNILIYGTYNNGAGDLNSNNLCNETQYPNVNGNQQNVDMSTVFEDYTTYIDNGYLLKAGSPAIGAGITGEDCGAYGTNDPYVLSGMPPVPAIFDVEMTQSIGTTTLPVTINAMSHK